MASHPLTQAKPSSSFRLRNPSLNTLRLRGIFDLFDSNSDGIITPSELSLALDRLGLSSDPDDVSSLISPFLPSPSSLGLDFNVFQAFHHSVSDALFGSCEDVDDALDDRVEETDLVEAFKVFDEDGDGFISSRELQAVLGNLGLEEGRSLERVNAMIGSVDSNHDGRVDFNEFKNMMQAVVVQGS